MAGFEPHATKIPALVLRLEHRLSKVHDKKPTKISTLKNRLFSFFRLKPENEMKRNFEISLFLKNVFLASASCQDRPRMYLSCKLLRWDGRECPTPKP